MEGNKAWVSSLPLFAFIESFYNYDWAMFLYQSLERDHNHVSLEQKYCQTMVSIVYLGSPFCT